MRKSLEGGRIEFIGLRVGPGNRAFRRILNRAVPQQRIGNDSP